MFLDFWLNINVASLCKFQIDRDKWIGYKKKGRDGLYVIFLILVMQISSSMICVLI